MHSNVLPNDSLPDFPFPLCSSYRGNLVRCAAGSKTARNGRCVAPYRVHASNHHLSPFLPSIHPGVFVIIIFITILVLFAIEQPDLGNSRFTCLKFSKFEVLLPKRL